MVVMFVVVEGFMIPVKLLMMENFGRWFEKKITSTYGLMLKSVCKNVASDGGWSISDPGWLMDERQETKLNNWV